MGRRRTSIAAERNRFVAWLRWYLRTHPSSLPSQSAMARKLGIARSAVNWLFDPDSTVVPSMSTLIAARNLTGVPIDVMLFVDPPEDGEVMALPLRPAAVRRAST